MRMPLLIKADVRTTKQSSTVYLGEGQWGFVVEGNPECKVAICYESPNGLKNQFTVLHDTKDLFEHELKQMKLIGPVRVFAIIEEVVGIKPISIFAVSNNGT
jgi:hypothetical protein